MRRSHLLFDRHVLVLQTSGAVATLVVGLVASTALVALSTMFTQNDSVVVSIALLGALPLVVCGHIWLYRRTRSYLEWHAPTPEDALRRQLLKYRTAVEGFRGRSIAALPRAQGLLERVQENLDTVQALRSEAVSLDKVDQLEQLDRAWNELQQLRRELEATLPLYTEAIRVATKHLQMLDIRSLDFQQLLQELLRMQADILLLYEYQTQLISADDQLKTFRRRHAPS
jgi:hypothetical protein